MPTNGGQLTKMPKAYKDKCLKGHPWPEFQHITKSGHSRCNKCHLVRQTAWDNRDKSKTQKRRQDYWLMKSYGLDTAKRDELLRNQGGMCAICKTTDFGKRGPFVDHNHSTSNLRGILCHWCNVAIGLFKENPERMYSAITYLKQF